MKKILIVSMVVIFSFMLSACGKKQETTNTQTVEQTPQEVTLTYTIKNRYNEYSLYSNGEVFAKGTNKCGELGLGHKVEMPTEVKIEGLTDIKKIVLQQNEDRGAAYFINSLGEVYVTGYNQHGQLGLGHTDDVIVPTKIESLVGIVDIEISEYSKCNTFFINQNGGVYVSGANSNGELGLGHKNKVTIPQKIDALNNTVIKKIVYDEGFGATVFLNNRGEIYVAGCKEIAEQKIEEPVAVENPSIPNLDATFLPNLEKEKVESESNVPAVEEENDKQEEQEPELLKSNDPTIPTKITALKGINVVDIVDEGDASQFKLYYITDKGEVYATGYNRSGALGINTEFNKVDDKKNEYISLVTPMKVTALSGIQIKGRVDQKFIGINDEKYQLINGDIPRAKQVK